MNHFEVDPEQLDWAFRQWIDQQPFLDLAAATANLDHPIAPDATATALTAFAARLTSHLQQLSIDAEDLGRRAFLAADGYADSEKRITGWMDR